MTCLEEDLVEDVMRLDELQDEHQERSWMWAPNPVTEPVPAEEAWVAAIRLRLGASHAAVSRY